MMLAILKKLRFRTLIQASDNFYGALVLKMILKDLTIFEKWFVAPLAFPKSHYNYPAILKYC